MHMELDKARRSLEEYAAARAKAVMYGDAVLCRVLGNLLLLVDPSDLTIGPRLALDGYWESWVTAAMLRHLKPSMACIDVGAHVGYYALAMAAAVGREGRVLAIEPQHAMVRRLRNNLILNGQEWIEVAHLAVAESPGMSVLSVPLGNPGGARLRVAQPTEEVHEMAVQTTTLDALLADWLRLDLVKLDVEGAESRVWRGASQTRRRFLEAVWIVELHVGLDRQAALGFLEEVEADGYAVRQITHDSAVVPLSATEVAMTTQPTLTLWLQR